MSVTNPSKLSLPCCVTGFDFFLLSKVERFAGTLALQSVVLTENAENKACMQISNFFIWLDQNISVRKIIKMARTLQNLNEERTEMIAILETSTTDQVGQNTLPNMSIEIPKSKEVSLSL